MFREYCENKPESDRARSAIARVNAVHQVYANHISNADMFYALALLVTDPIMWVDR